MLLTANANTGKLWTHAYYYTPNQKVLKKVHDPTKLANRTTGPYNISWVHTNGTVTINIVLLHL